MNSPVSKSRRHQAVLASHVPADQRRRRYLNDWVEYLALTAHLFTLRVAGAARSRCVDLSCLVLEVALEFLVIELARNANEERKVWAMP